MKPKPIFPLILSLAAVLFSLLHAAEPARIWEQELVLPTYEIGAPDPNPFFYTGRIYQGAQGRVYPYPMLDVLTDNRRDKTYTAVYLENEYLRLCLLPELGGRLFSALDRTNDHDFIYRQSVVKPALIGMLGAWISGGVEWNIPHHHRASTYMPLDYRLEENGDGSRTVWFGELEIRHRMSWVIGITVFPDKSYFKATVRLFNRTPLANPIMYWANLSVHANEKYQVLFPPGTQYATDHNKIDFTGWPVATGVYRGVDYGDGVDLSWWKNHPRQTSCFAWNYEDDFVAGYDHGLEAGICHIAEHHTVPGKKFFEWGNGPVGWMWDKVLTETDGPYLEIMTGAWSDNQPDYSWCQPGETRVAEQYWYPIRGIRGVKKANLQAAVNLEKSGDDKIFIGFNTTSLRPGCTVRLQSGGRVLDERVATISPDRPFVLELPIPVGVAMENLKVTLLDSSSVEIISYQPAVQEKQERPEPVETPPAPGDIATIEELYLTGMRLEQLYNPVLDPYPYYEEALRRDPGDYRVNTALGILYLKRHMFAQAERHLRRAVERATRNHIMPRDGEAFYYLGLALRQLGKPEEARDFLFKATWSHAFRSAAYYQLAELGCSEGDPALTLEYLDRSLETNALNTQTLALKATLARRNGDRDAAEAALEALLKINPVDFRADYERIMLLPAKESAVSAREYIRNIAVMFREYAAQCCLELAADYYNCGLDDEALGVLFACRESGVDDHPMVMYWTAGLLDRQGRNDEARRYFAEASRLSPKLCFPFRSESITVLRRAMEVNPSDARSRYYLGNLLYDHQPEEAVREWEKSRELDSSFWTVHRNLGFAYLYFENNYQKSAESYARALMLEKNEPRLFFEHDRACELAGTDPEKRLRTLLENHGVLLARYDAVTRETALLVQLGRYDEAIALLSDYHFHKWEGVGEIHNIYKDAYLLRGSRKQHRGEYGAALEDYLKALEYPLNLEVGKPYRDEGSWRVHYFVASAFDALGDRENAMRHYREAVPDYAAPSEILYYQALALRKLGNETAAADIFDRLVSHGSDRLLDPEQSDVFAKFGERTPRKLIEAEAHFLIGLGHLGKGDRRKAREHLEQAARLDINHLGAKTQLAGL